MKNTTLTLVVPCYNEEDNVLPFYKRHARILKTVRTRYNLFLLMMEAEIRRFRTSKRFMHRIRAMSRLFPFHAILAKNLLFMQDYSIVAGN